MENIFDPTNHRVVAITGDGKHLHVSLAELASDIASLHVQNLEPPPPPPPNPVQPVHPVVTTETERLLLAGIVANDAIGRGVSAGDLMWHGGSKPFQIGGVVMDAPGLLEYARARLAQLTD